MAERSPPRPLEEMLRSAAAGDGGAWRALVAAYSGRVFGLLVRQCRDRDLAEELTQATFVKLVTQLRDGAGYEERGRFEAWLFRIAMNGLRDEMRRRKRQAVPVEDPGVHLHDGEATGGSPRHAAEDPLEAASRAEQIEQLRAAIARLSEADQQILHLRHTAGLSFAQIAEVLGEPLGTVLARGHRAVGKLRQMMAKVEVE